MSWSAEDANAKAGTNRRDTETQIPLKKSYRDKEDIMSEKTTTTAEKKAKKPPKAKPKANPSDATKVKTLAEVEAQAGGAGADAGKPADQAPDDPKPDSPKTEEHAPEKVKIKLTRHVGYLMPGTITKVDAAEAERLIADKKAILYRED